MNQILYVDNKKNRKKKKGKNSLTEKLRRFAPVMSVVILGVGILFIGKGTLAVMDNDKNSKILEKVTPVATMEQNGENLAVRAKHIRPISSIIYSWNNEEEKTINTKNKTIVAETIAIPRGSNTLNLEVKDNTGKKSNYVEQFTNTEGTDTQKPKIDFILTGNNLRIQAKDDLEIAYLTYRWNEETEEIVHPTGADKAFLEETIEVRKGQNKLTVTAVDSSNNSTTEEKEFKGLIKPTVEIYVDGDSIVIIARHEVAVQRIDYTFNGQKYSVMYAPGPEMQYRQKMVEGNNVISVQAYSTEGAVGTAEGETYYTPQR